MRFLSPLLTGPGPAEVEADGVMTRRPAGATPAAGALETTSGFRPSGKSCRIFRKD